MVGMDVRICAPEPLPPSVQVQDIAAKLAAGFGARVAVTADIAAAGYLYAGAWLPVGEPADDWDERIDLLLPYQVNQGVLTATGNPAVKFMHGLPAVHNQETAIGQRLQRRRGPHALEVTEEVFESPASIVFDQGEPAAPSRRSWSPPPVTPVEAGMLVTR
jgi:ornithine carbamoyltransferase